MKNTADRFGWLSRSIHWLSALLVVGLFVLGLWMVSLDYYHEWYRTAPDLHRSFGIVLMLLTVARLVWYRISPKPKALAHYAKWEHVTAIAVQHTMILTLFVLFFSGYLITTAQGDSLFVFSGIEIPALISGIDNLEDIAGSVHEFAAFFLIGLASLHMLAALKHHFIDRDATLKRMLCCSTVSDTSKPSGKEGA